MECFIKENSKNRQCVVYKIRIYTGKHNYQYHYIGQTKRTIEDRFKEHLTSRNSAVYKFINEHKDIINKVTIEVMYQVDCPQNLERAESIAIGKYLLARGTRANKKNRLINVQLKDYEREPLKKVKEDVNKLLDPMDYREEM